MSADKDRAIRRQKQKRAKASKAAEKTAAPPARRGRRAGEGGQGRQGERLGRPRAASGGERLGALLGEPLPEDAAEVRQCRVGGDRQQLGVGLGVEEASAAPR